MQTNQNIAKNIIPKIKTNKANTHTNTRAKRPTNKTRARKATENGWKLKEGGRKGRREKEKKRKKKKKKSKQEEGTENK